MVLNQNFFYFLTVIAFIFGACIGSFLNVVILRTMRGMSLNHPPSHCYTCGNLLSMMIDNIPILGWFALKGKCRKCGATYSFSYSFNELKLGLLCSLVFFAHAPGPQIEVYSLAVCVVLAALLFILSKIDHQYSLIPDKITIPFIAIFVYFSLFINSNANSSLQDPTNLHKYLFIIAAVLFAIYFTMTHIEMDSRKQRHFHFFCIIVTVFSIPLALILNKYFYFETPAYWDKLYAMIYLGGTLYFFSIINSALDASKVIIAEGDAKLILLIAAALGTNVTLKLIIIWLFVFILFSPIIIYKKAKSKIKKPGATFLIVIFLFFSTALLFVDYFVLSIKKEILHVCLGIFVCSGLTYFIMAKRWIDQKFFPARIPMAPLIFMSYVFLLILNLVIKTK